ncbi:hypothetical protein CPAR01_05713 [Colletotrichum paranaense]|uniref:Uncharacterized protein n=1 Tax=Colletotrichum paranaense TaxID=1914294 RepID=A0ABQ9SS40_9PEZI|nr:uncharacterized protein CPAR01_05713 [Colletotrichum paranaense]KAK1542326.1 hypothetical protein CPAR01_05713 [Colletotrichum paranaense]
MMLLNLRYHPPGALPAANPFGTKVTERKKAPNVISRIESHENARGFSDEAKSITGAVDPQSAVLGYVDPSRGGKAQAGEEERKTLVTCIGVCRTWLAPPKGPDPERQVDQPA